MLPSAYQTPAALVLLVGGVLACFTGHRLFKLVLAIYGFVAGALVATSMLGAENLMWTVLTAFGGGLLGSLALILAYFAGVALVGAGAGALLLHVAFASFDREPHVLFVIAAAALGAIVAMILQKSVIVLVTAFGGAWTVILAGVALFGERRTLAATSGGPVWIPYPLHPAPGEAWVIVAWLALGAAGTVVQLKGTARGKR